jgi:hypothetical protein
MANNKEFDEVTIDGHNYPFRAWTLKFTSLLMGLLRPYKSPLLGLPPFGIRRSFLLLFSSGLTPIRISSRSI